MGIILLLCSCYMIYMLQGCFFVFLNFGRITGIFYEFLYSLISYSCGSLPSTRKSRSDFASCKSAAWACVDHGFPGSSAADMIAGGGATPWSDSASKVSGASNFGLCTFMSMSFKSVSVSSTKASKSTSSAASNAPKESVQRKRNQKGEKITRVTSS